MLKIIGFAMAAVAMFAAEDGWLKVKELKSGTELRIYRKEVKQPVEAKLDEAFEDKLIVVVKNEQTAIPKDEIDRVDFRPEQKGSRVTRQTTTKVEDPRPGTSTEVLKPQGAPGPSTSTSTSMSMGGKPAFETIYRRTAIK